MNVYISGQIISAHKFERQPIRLHQELLVPPQWTLVSGPKEVDTQVSEAADSTEGNIFQSVYEYHLQCTDMKEWPQIELTVYHSN